MARTRVEVPATTLKSWDDVDTTLAEIGEHERAKAVLEAAMQEQIDEIKLRVKMDAAPHMAAIAHLEDEIKGYVDDHAQELKGKSRKLNFGVVGYRKSTKVVLPRAAAKVMEIIAKLRSQGMSDCIVESSPKIDKDALRKYPPNDIAEVGAGLDIKDTFWYEVDRDRVEAVHTGKG